MRTLILALLTVIAVAAPWRGLIRDERDDTGVPVVEMAVFEAGFGVEWHRRVAREYENLRAAQGRPVHVDLWGDTRGVDKVRPRILSHQPPVLIDAYLPFWTLVLSGVIVPFDDVLDRPASIPGRTLRDTFYPGALGPATYKGEVYAVPTLLNAWMIWYDRRLWRERGWEVPETWQELSALCERIKSPDLAPVAFQGKYSGYANCYFWHLVQNCGGMAVYDRCQAIEPGAFLDPGVIEAARLMQRFALNCFQPNSASMTHTEAQTEFALGRAAMVACGLWFEHEMKHLLPEDMELSAFPMPPLAGGKGDPRALYAGPAEMIYLFRDGRSRAEALDFMAYLLSVDNMRSFAEHASTLSAVAPANRDADLSPAMKTVRDAVERRTLHYFDMLYSYAQTWDRTVKEPAYDLLITGRITPEQFAERLERGMEAFRNDPDFLRPEFTVR